MLVDGFYDSQDKGGYRHPWHFQLKNDAPMFMAGLWEPRPDAGNFAIISAPANRLMARVIDRMPVILPPDHCRRWLDATAEPEELQSLLVTLPSEQITKARILLAPLTTTEMQSLIDNALSLAKWRKCIPSFSGARYRKQAIDLWPFPCGVLQCQRTLEKSVRKVKEGSAFPDAIFAY